MYYKGKRLMTVNGKLLDDRTIRKYNLEKDETTRYLRRNI